MITTDFIYIFLNLLMLAIFIIVGRNISRDKKHYWQHAIWAVITFTLMLGLRLNRGNDYVHYMEVYRYNEEKNQWLFYSFNQFLKFLGTGGHWIFIWYSGAFIIGAAFLLKRFREYAYWLFPLFLMSFTYFSEYMIRQAFSFTFIFFMTHYLIDERTHLKKKTIQVLICLAVAYSIHSANVLIGLLIIVFYYFVRRPFPFVITIPAYIFASYVFSKIFDFSSLNVALSFLGGQDEKFSQYTENADRWFSSEAVVSAWERNPIVKILETTGNCALMYLGSKLLVLKQNKGMLTLFNLFVFGAIFSQCFFTIELGRRMGDIMFWHWAFPLAFVLCNKSLLIKNTKKGFHQWIVNASYLALIFYAYDYLKYIFLRDAEMYHFLWDL